MIKPTYYNLPKEKRIRLIKAAKNEFMRASWHEASINRIVKEADISRGSFYTYFDDKFDLMDAMLSEFNKLMQGKTQEIIEKSDGDIFKFAIDVFDVALQYGNLHADMRWFHNVFSSEYTLYKRNEKSGDAHPFSAANREKSIEKIKDSLDFSNYTIGCEEEKTALIDMVFTLIGEMARRVFNESDTADAARKRFLLLLNIMQNGINKKDEKIEKTEKIERGKNSD